MGTQNTLPNGNYGYCALLNDECPNDKNPRWRTYTLYGGSKKGLFHWGDGSMLTYDKWNSSSTVVGTNKLCVQLTGQGQKSWVDTNCMQKSAYVCQMRKNDLGITILFLFLPTTSQ